MRTLLVVTLLALGACAGPIARECDKASQCGELGDRTADQCTADWEKKQEDVQKDPACQNLVDKTIALWDCQSDLTCEERKDISKTVCKGASSDLVGATLSSLGCLFK